MGERHTANGGSRRRRRFGLDAAWGAALSALVLFWALCPAGRPWGCAGESPGHERWNVLLVSLDTTRPDRLAACDGSPVLTPSLDRIRGGGHIFAEMVSPAPVTLPAHASLFTGDNPYRTGVRENTEYMLAPGTSTLAETFRDAGYSTAAFVAAFVMNARFGLGQGFDLYQDNLSGPEPGLRPYNIELPGEVVATRAARWIQDYVHRRGAGEEKRPFFLFVHFYDAHAPYRPPQPFDQAHVGHPYEGELAYQDHALGVVLDALEASGEAGRTLVWVVSDHGESLGEHGEATHSLFIYEGALRVVSILRLPPDNGRLSAGEPQARIRTQTSLIDVAPTLLALCGIEQGLPQAEGHSLADLIERGSSGGSGRGGDTSAGNLGRAVYSETLSPLISYHWAPLFGVRTTEWKYIRCPQPELYNLQVDPREITNTATQHPEVVARLEEELDAFLACSDSTGGADARSALSAAERERLRSLGYISGAEAAGAKPSGRAGAATLPDPKAMVDFFNQQYQQAKNLLYTGRHAEAIEALHAALRIDPLNNALYFNLGMALRYANRPREAAAAFRQALRIEPRASRAWIGWGKTLLQTGEPDSAVWAFDQARVLLPRSPDPWMALGDAFWLTGRYPDAAVAYDSALALGGFEQVLHGLQARLYAEHLGDPQRAQRHLEAFARLLGITPDEARQRLPQPEGPGRGPAGPPSQPDR
jgi:choline-sulfatase